MAADDSDGDLVQEHGPEAHVLLGAALAERAQDLHLRVVLADEPVGQQPDLRAHGDRSGGRPPARPPGASRASTTAPLAPCARRLCSSGRRMRRIASRRRRRLRRYRHRPANQRGAAPGEDTAGSLRSCAACGGRAGLIRPPPPATPGAQELQAGWARRCSPRELRLRCSTGTFQRRLPAWQGHTARHRCWTSPLEERLSALILACNLGWEL